MPTIRNDGRHIHMVTLRDGRLCELRPGMSAEIYDIAALSLPGITETSPAPYYNPASACADLTSAGPGDDRVVTIEPGTESVEIVNNSPAATITAFIDSTENVPGLRVVPQSRRVVDGIRGRARNLVLRFSAAAGAGECFVTQLK